MNETLKTQLFEYQISLLCGVYENVCRISMEGGIQDPQLRLDHNLRLKFKAKGQRNKAEMTQMR